MASTHRVQYFHVVPLYSPLHSPCRTVLAGTASGMKGCLIALPISFDRLCFCLSEMLLHGVLTAETPYWQNPVDRCE